MVLLWFVSIKFALLTLRLKVIACSQHTHTTRLVCPEDMDMYIVIDKTKEDTLALFWKSFKTR